MLLLDGDVHDVFLSLFIVSFVLADDLKMNYANTPDGVVMSKWTITAEDISEGPWCSENWKESGRGDAVRTEIYSFFYYYHYFVDFYCLFRWSLCCLFRAQTYYNDPELRRRVSGAGTTAGVVNTGGTHTSTASITKPVFPPSPSDVWSTDVMALPAINVGVLFQYLCVREQQSMGGDAPALTQKPLHRGYQFYYWSFIHNVRICLLPEKEQGMAVHLLTSQCWASQRKQMKYIQELKLVECVSGVGVRLDYASCACPAGVGGGCQHIAALFFHHRKVQTHCCGKTAWTGDLHVAGESMGSKAKRHRPEATVRRYCRTASCSSFVHRN